MSEQYYTVHFGSPQHTGHTYDICIFCEKPMLPIEYVSPPGFTNGFCVGWHEHFKTIERRRNITRLIKELFDE